MVLGMDNNFWIKVVDTYYDNPIGFFEDILNFFPDTWQGKAAESVRDNPKTAIRSGQGVGKSALTACLMLWYIAMHPYSRIIATAPTKKQLEDVLWAEINKWLTGTILDGKIIWTKTRVEMSGYGAVWYATAKTATRPENMQGYHEQYMLFVVDEASGVEDKILEAILGTLGHKDNRLLLLGNPTKTTGVFHDAFFKDKVDYFTFKVNARNVKRTNKDNIASLIRKYGEDSNVVRVRVDGEFPKQEDDVFIPLEFIEQSIMTEYIERAIESIDIGVDVARFGDDETVISDKINNKILPLKIRRGQDLMRTSGDVLFLCTGLKGKYPKFFMDGGKIKVKIDDTGLGGGVTDRLKEVIRDKNINWIEIYPVNMAKSIHHKFYYDITTYLWSVVREQIDISEGKKCELILPNDDDLVGQLSCRKYTYHSSGKIKVESKKEMKDRGLRSPDRADAVTLACLPVKKPKINERKKGGRAGRI